MPGWLQTLRNPTTMQRSRPHSLLRCVLVRRKTSCALVLFLALTGTVRMWDDSGEDCASWAVRMRGHW
eukprot:260045-Chlamydomonas_euryale.AAC.1